MDGTRDVRQSPGRRGFLVVLAVAATIAPQATAADQGASDGYMIIEGDIIVPEDFFDLRSAYATNLWPGGIVPYEYDANVSASNQAEMQEAMGDWQARANVQFVPRTAEANYVHIQSAGVNSSYVGMIGGQQVLNIVSWGARTVMAHELAHALGVWHEQSRPDRDSYVQINAANIQAGAAHNFDIRADAGTYGPYDFESIMHYDQCAFSICCPSGTGCACDSTCWTITVLPPYEAWQSLIGEFDAISLGDAQGMGFLYGFDGPDCNGNHVRDQVDIAEGFSEDCDLDAMPDECLSDCNVNLLPDGDDIAAGSSPDANGNGVPDECEQTRLFVRRAATGTDNGTTWTDAMTSVQRALRVAERAAVATEIWVAAGTYTPEHCVSARADSFVLRSEVTLYGGFAGNEDPQTFDLATRDFTSNETT